METHMRVCRVPTCGRYDLVEGRLRSPPQVRYTEAVPNDCLGDYCFHDGRGKVTLVCSVAQCNGEPYCCDRSSDLRCSIAAYAGTG
jgi:hypothetical protein